MVDEIINEWNAELERRSRAFVKQAEALAQWDLHILSNRHTLLELEEQLRKVTMLLYAFCDAYKLFKQKGTRSKDTTKG